MRTKGVGNSIKFKPMRTYGVGDALIRLVDEAAHDDGAGFQATVQVGRVGEVESWATPSVLNLGVQTIQYTVAPLHQRRAIVVYYHQLLHVLFSI